LFTFTESRISAADGIKLAVYRWENENKQAPICLIVHGMAEYGLRYRRLVEDLEKTGWAFAAFDMRGHGYSEGSPMRMKSIDEPVLDLAEVTHFLRGQDGRKRTVVLLGHSFGGLIATLYASKSPADLSGLVLSSPALGMYFLFPFMDKVIELMHGLIPDRVIPKPVHSEKLSHDPAVQNAYRQDKLIYKFVGIDFLYQMLKGMRFVEKNMYQIHVPLLMILAGNDQIVDNRKNIAFFNRLTGAPKEIQIFDGLLHETFNELGRAKSIDRLRHFLHDLNQ